MNNKCKLHCLLPTVFILLVSQTALAEQAAEPAMGDPAAVVSKVVMGLVVVTALIFALGWGVKRLGLAGLNGQKNMRVISSLAVGGRERVVLIDVAGEKILLGIAPGRVNYLQSIHADFDDVPVQSSSTVSSTVKTSKTAVQSENDFSAYLKNILTPGNK